MAFTLAGSYAVIAPSGIDYSLDGGVTWMSALSPIIANGQFSFSVIVAGINPLQRVAVRDRVAHAVVATSGAFAVTAASGESPEGAIVTTVGPTITDAAGNVYAISSSGFIVTNGSPEMLISANVVELAYHAPVAGGPRQLYQKNSAGTWYTRTSVTAAYVDAADPTV